MSKEDASFPPPYKKAKHTADLSASGAAVEKPASALASFEAVLAASKGKQIVMFLDYDGTLSPIVEDPDRAVMSEEMREAVRLVAEHFAIVFNFVKLTELYYAGSHGMDIQGPANHLQANAEAVQFQAGSEFLPIIQEVFGTLTAKMESIAGAKVEHNKYCLSVHYRCVEKKEWDTVDAEVESVLKQSPNLKLTQGKRVLEIRPPIEWDKGEALEFLLQSLGYAGRNDVFPVYIGDDRTDEDAFKGIGILVSDVPKDTAASYLRHPAKVEEFLRKLAKSQT